MPNPFPRQPHLQAGGPGGGGGGAGGGGMTPDQIFQDLIIRLTTVVEGHERAQRNVRSVTRAYRDFEKVGNRIGKMLRGTLAKGFAAVTTAAGLTLKTVKDSGNEFLRFERLAGKGAKSLNNLEAAYKSVNSQIKSTVVSMQDAAGSMADFMTTMGRVSIVNMAKFKKGWIGIQDVLTRGIGKKAGKQLMDDVIGSLMENQLEAAIRLINAGSDRQSILAALDQVSLPMLDPESRQRLQEFRNSVKDTGDEIHHLTGPIKGWNDLMSRLGTIIENVQAAFLKAFGADIRRAIKYVHENVDTAFESVRNWIVENQVVEKVKGYWESFLGVMRRLIDWYSKLSDSSKKLLITTGLLAALLGPGNALGLVASLGSLVIQLGRVSGAFRAASGQAAAFRFAAGGVIAGVAGVELGRMGARALGAERHSAGEFLGGVGSGMAAGAAVAGAPGAAAGGIYGIGRGVYGVGKAHHDISKLKTESAGAAAGTAWQNLSYANNQYKSAKTELDKIRAARRSTSARIALSKDEGEIKVLRARMQALHNRESALAGTAGDPKGQGGRAGVSVATAKKFWKDMGKSIVDSGKKFATAVKKASDDAAQPMARFEVAMGKLRTKVVKMDANTSLANTFADAMSTLGPGGFAQGVVATASGYGRSLASEALKDAQAAYAILDDADDKAAALQELQESWAKIANAISSANKNLIAADQARLDRLEKITAIRETELSISRALYGTAALAVTKQMDLVHMYAAQLAVLGKQEQALQDQRAIQSSKFANASDEEKVELRMELWDIENKIFEIQGKQRQMQQRQVETLKELRDGYLDAVKAQAMAAGRFSKIIIEQDRNIAMGLEKGIAKPNFLLGSTGTRSRLDSYRFSESGYGALEYTGGGRLTARDVQSRQEEIIRNMPASQRAMGRLTAAAVQAALEQYLGTAYAAGGDSTGVGGAVLRAARGQAARSPGFVKKRAPSAPAVRSGTGSATSELKNAAKYLGELLTWVGQSIDEMKYHLNVEDKKVTSGQRNLPKTKT